MNTSLIAGLATNETLTVSKIDEMLATLKPLPINPLDRVRLFRCHENMVTSVKEAIREAQKLPGVHFPVQVEANAFVPPGYALGFSAKGELLLLIGPPKEA